MTWNINHEELDATPLIDEDTSPVAAQPGDWPGRDGLCDDAFSWMWKRCQKFPLLTPQREVELAARVAQGDQAAKDEMIESNLRLVVSIAHRCYRFAGPSLSMADLVQEGTIGLIRAVDKFDQRRGFRFSTYASFWIRQAMMRAIRDRGAMIRLPNHASDKLYQAERARATLTQTLERAPTISELARVLDVDVDKLQTLINSASEPTSLDDLVGALIENGADSPAVWDEDEPSPLEKAFRNLNQRDLLDTLGVALQSLGDREAKIIALRYGLHDGTCHTFEQVATQLHMPRHSVRKLENSALRSLREYEPLHHFAGVA